MLLSTGTLASAEVNSNPCKLPITTSLPIPCSLFPGTTIMMPKIQEKQLVQIVWLASQETWMCKKLQTGTKRSWSQEDSFLLQWYAGHFFQPNGHLFLNHATAHLQWNLQKISSSFKDWKSIALQTEGIMPFVLELTQWHWYEKFLCSVHSLWQATQFIAINQTPTNN